MKKMFLAAVLSVVASQGLAAEFCQRVLPPNALRREPNVPYSIKYSGNPSTQCHTGFALSCAGRCKTGAWVIWIDRDFDAVDKRCAILHEKAHLPPNNWKASHKGSRAEPLPMGAWQPDC